MPVTKSDLHIDWASHKAADYACRHWHYSGCMPSGKTIKLGAWEGGRYIGVVIFGRGANNNMSKAYGLQQQNASELVRIALRDHAAPVSRIVSICLKMVRAYCPGVRLIVSYADPAQGHHGGIYQAGNWIYSGRSQAQAELIVGGKHMHKRSVTARYGTAAIDEVARLSGQKVERGPVQWKHVYLMPLDDEIRQRVAQLAKEYPRP